MSLSAKPCQHMVPQRCTRGPELDQIRFRSADYHWQIDSEFRRTNTRYIIVDLSKLVMGPASHQLFTTSHRHGRNEDVVEVCSEPAGCCGGKLYFAFISHPADWGRLPAPEGPTVYQWIARDWQQLLPPATTS